MLTVTGVVAVLVPPFSVAVTVMFVALADSARLFGDTESVTVFEASSSSSTVTLTVPAVSEP